MTATTKPVIFVLGPTASGKTALALELAGRLDGEIISADAMQVYRGFDIGTAKPTMEERCGIAHHMLSIVAPDTAYSVAQYKRDACACLQDIHARGKRAIVCGGTGQYIQALTMPMDYAKAPSDAPLRRELEALADERGNAALQSELARLDPVSAARIHVNDRKRLIRALEVCRLTGRAFSHHDNAPPPIDNAVKIGLTMAREALIERIDRRVDVMIRSGLFEEIETLRRDGITRDMPAAQALGYKELWDAALCPEARAEAVQTLKIATRQYAKRQMTWFRKDTAIQWLDASRNDVLLESAMALIEHAGNTEQGSVTTPWSSMKI